MNDQAQPWQTPHKRVCATCGTELAPRALACPACHTLVHADRLRLLAARAERLTADGKLDEARSTWEEALTLLPPATRQHTAIVEKAQALATRIADADPEIGSGATAKAHGPWYRRWAGGIGAVLILLLTKGKFLLLGLTKLPTFFSMFAFFGVYWAAFGWPLALGLVVSIYIHEMGHVAAIVRLGGKPSAPMFIPGVGAFVSYSRRIADPREDAYIGLAGPIWGATAGLVAFAIGTYTGDVVWIAIARLTGWLNLFNLLPVFGLDGSHGFKALDAPQRIAVGVAFGLAAWLCGFPLLVVPALISVFRATAAIPAFRTFGDSTGPGDARTLANFIGLIAVLGWMSTLRPI